MRNMAEKRAVAATAAGCYSTFFILGRLGIFLTLLAIILMDYAAAGSVGYSSYNSSVWQFWNGGSIENVTFVTTDLMQFANRPERFGWGSYTDCAVVRNLVTNGTAWHCLDSLGGLRPVPDSDNVSFWSLSGSRDSGVGALGVIAGQKVFDDYVNLTVWANLSASLPPSRELWLAHCIDRIDVDLDGDADAVNAVADGQEVGFFVNDSAFWGWQSWNVSDSVSVGDLDSDSGIRWHVPGRGGVSWNGSRLCVLSPVPAVQGFRQASFFWIDVDVCLYTTIPGCTRTFFNLSFFNVAAVNGRVEFFANVTFTCNSIAGCGKFSSNQNCNNETFIGNGCYVKAYDNTTWNNATLQEINDSQSDPKLECGGLNNYAPMCSRSSFVQGRSANFSVYCHALVNYFQIQACWKTGSSGCPTFLNVSNIKTGINNISCGSRFSYPTLNVSANDTSVINEEWVNYTANVSSTLGLRNISFAWNATGSWVNISRWPVSGTWLQQDYIKQSPAINAVVGFLFWAYDIEGNYNESRILTVTMKYTPVEVVARPMLFFSNLWGMLFGWR